MYSFVFNPNEMEHHNSGNADCDGVVKTNSAHAWWLAARPKTLSGAAVPVIVGAALAAASSHGGVMWAPVFLCLLFALVMQVDANLVNDYFDFARGGDSAERLGPRRACANGWVSLPAMRRAIACVSAIACAAGLPLVLYGGWWLVAVGAACVAFCFLYTTHLSRMAMGDVLVFVFFGIVPVCCTYWLAMPEGSDLDLVEPLAAAAGCGLVIDTLLIVNNFRDIEEDGKNGKKTLAVVLGRKGALAAYLAAGALGWATAAAGFAYSGHWWAVAATAAYLPLHCKSFLGMKRIWAGKRLNMVLGATARNMLLYGILAAAGLAVS